MPEVSIDNTDRAILYELQQDARNRSNTEIAERLDLSPSTVGKRISRLEEAGVLRGYTPEIDYERAGFPLQVLFICTTPITDREPLIKEALQLKTVVNVREMMTGQGNVHILIVGQTNDDITQTAHEVDEIGFAVSDEILMRSEYNRPSIIFEDERRNPSF